MVDGWHAVQQKLKLKCSHAQRTAFNFRSERHKPTNARQTWVRGGGGGWEGGGAYLQPYMCGPDVQHCKDWNVGETSSACHHTVGMQVAAALK